MTGTDREPPPPCRGPLMQCFRGWSQCAMPRAEFLRRESCPVWTEASFWNGTRARGVWRSDIAGPDRIEWMRTVPRQGTEHGELESLADMVVE